MYFENFFDYKEQIVKDHAIFMPSNFYIIQVLIFFYSVYQISFLSNIFYLHVNKGLQRCGKSCRLRWINYLRPDVKRGNFTAEEEETIIRLHKAMGNK